MGTYPHSILFLYTAFSFIFLSEIQYRHSQNSHPISSLQPRVTYVLWMTAVTAAGESPQGNEREFCPQGKTLKQPVHCGLWHTHIPPGFFYLTSDFPAGVARLLLPWDALPPYCLLEDSTNSFFNMQEKSSPSCRKPGEAYVHYCTLYTPSTLVRWGEPLKP